MTDVVEDLEQSRALGQVKTTFAGFVGGAVQVLVGQPFDLIK